jgi:Fe-S-cluster-containing hydrogenase component 2
MAFNPIVDEEKCAGCEECVDVCPVEVFEMQDGKSVPVNRAPQRPLPFWTRKITFIIKNRSLSLYLHLACVSKIW